MSLYKRLLFYFFGFTIGLIFLFFFMNKKEATFNYSPNKRVLADIQKKNGFLFQLTTHLKSKKPILLIISKLIFQRVMLN